MKTAAEFHVLAEIPAYPRGGIPVERLQKRCQGDRWMAVHHGSNPPCASIVRYRGIWPNPGFLGLWGPAGTENLSPGYMGRAGTRARRMGGDLCSGRKRRFRGFRSTISTKPGGFT